MYLVSCGAQERTITQIKQLRKSSFVSPKNLTGLYSVTGYFYQDPTPLLIIDPDWAYVNRPMPDSAYIVLNGNEAFLASAGRMQGRLITVRGLVNSLTDSIGGRKVINNRIIHYDVDLNVINTLQVGKMVQEEQTNPLPINHCSINHELCQRANIDQPNFALLYAGGIDFNQAHMRYWNDLTFMYHTLRSKYGYTDDQIVVIYKDGIGEDGQIAVDYPATANGVKEAFQLLKSRLSDTTDLFIFMSNHGGGYDEKDKSSDGLGDQVVYDEIDKYKIDEVTYYYEQSPIELSDDSLVALVNQLRFRKLAGLFEQCYSGGFLYDLRGTNRIIMSAAHEFEVSYSNKMLTYDEFSYHFTCALNKATPENEEVNADSDNNGWISMLEAFNYARKKDRRRESPHLEDSGDGIGVERPAALPGFDGYQASQFKLGKR
jgi:hypothetical protein